MERLKKLNLGCGKYSKKGYINLDIVKLPGVDIVHNLNEYPYPFKDNTFEYIFCDNVLEHLNDIIKPVEEIWRISKNKAEVRVIVPIFPSVWSFCDPTHKSVYTYFTFNYFRKEDGLNYYSKARFKIKSRKINFKFRPIGWIINSTIFTQKAWALYLSHIMHASSLDIILQVEK